MAEEASDDIGKPPRKSAARGPSDASEVPMRSPHRTFNPAGRGADGHTARPGPLRLADRSCCPARPVVTVVIPPGPGRPRSADLLLCGHHYLASRANLAAVGASVIDVTGTVMDPVPAGCQRSQT
jgi:hypothetical protein